MLLLNMPALGFYMKVLFIFLIALMPIPTCFGIGHHHNAPITHAARNSFSKQYPAARVKKWTIAHDTCIVKFISSKKKETAFYLQDGTWVKTETKIPWTWNLPPAVKYGWEHCRFVSWPVEHINETNSPDGKQYVINVYQDCTPLDGVAGSSLERYRLTFSPDGTLLDALQTEQP